MKYIKPQIQETTIKPMQLVRAKLEENWTEISNFTRRKDTHPQLLNSNAKCWLFNSNALQMTKKWQLAYKGVQ